MDFASKAAPPDMMGLKSCDQLWEVPSFTCSWSMLMATEADTSLSSAGFITTNSTRMEPSVTLTTMIRSWLTPTASARPFWNLALKAAMSPEIVENSALIRRRALTIGTASSEALAEGDGVRLVVDGFGATDGLGVGADRVVLGTAGLALILDLAVVAVGAVVDVSDGQSSKMHSSDSE
eukprot:CAMPEP_0197701170 /NCGR_PEP_ID=MMETSP1338-20131121/122873_1 /TAXON_ID=43686 ORGANISM="Pelagodinium beii, Strain RCC1491" /NCGR_SAMPLE_ID=MMETSP1338 /ASSEMBLY_ACC=CAM_ASM_000754 /LENGTH=178 /DNA_ID=CAMNT_0043284845 /DNA_START=128 /DNA_END=664 /DNA_ORIENTATION=-